MGYEPVSRSWPMVRSAPMPHDDELDLSLNPHRVEEREAAAQETVDRLRRRGINVSAREKPEDLADLLTAVEQFEDRVEARGGDLMVDDLRSSQPDDPQYVIPQRESGEPLRR